MARPSKQLQLLKKRQKMKNRAPKRILGSVYNMPVMIKRSVALKTTTINNQFQGDAIAFKLSDLPNNADITNLFDYYKFMGVKIKFIYSHNSSEAGAIGFNLPNLVYTYDYDDANLPLSENELLERSTTKLRRMDKPISMYIKPKINNEIYNNGITTAYALSKGENPYIDSSNSGVNHFGLKYGIVLNSAQNGNGVLKVYATYYLKCLHTA